MSMNKETHDNLWKQHKIYEDKFFIIDKSWYRRIFGGHWRLIKSGKDTPYIGMFIHWTKLDLDNYHGHIEVLQEETYPLSYNYSKWSVFKEVFKYRLKSLLLINYFERRKEYNTNKNNTNKYIPKDIEKWMDNFLKR